MKAVAIREHGDLGCLRMEDLPEPKALRGEAVVAVRAAALNHLDVWVRRGGRGPALQKPHILGSDASGVVAQLGEGVTRLKVGDEVVLNPGLSCGVCENCVRGEHSECERFGIVGLSSLGTFAERLAVSADNLYPKPAHLSFGEAAALPLAYVTAWRMLMTRAQLCCGETVLIHGIGGGVALAALQFSKIAGAKTIVTSSSDEKLSRARGLGADFTVNYHKTSDVAKEVGKITNGRGVDVAVNTVGAAAWPIDFDCLRRGGKLVICGVTTGAAAQTNLQALYWKQLTVLGSTLGSRGDFERMIQAAAASGLKPVIDSVYPLEDFREAMEKMESGLQFGKLVLKIPD